MVRYLFTIEDLARLRFAISPMWELTNSLLALRDPASASLHLPWLRTISGRLDGLDLVPAVQLVPGRRYQPDFMAPPPSGPLGEIAQELDLVRSTPAEQVRREMEIFRRDHGADAIVAPWLKDPTGMVRRLADTLEAYWDRALAPAWPRIRALLDADLMHRSRRLTEGGPAAVFADLHPAIVWRGDRLEVHTEFSHDVHLEGRGLLLMPSVFAWRRPLAVTVEPWQPTVVYPARGVATVWDEGSERAHGGLARVLGATRARLLGELDAPRSTTELARRLDVTPGAVSQHLSALRAAGLVTGDRVGREVLYVRTRVADALVE